MAELYWLKRPIAHRGLHDQAKGIVENSASAVRAAMGGGYAVEVDLQCCAGDMPVVFHDATLDRLTAEMGHVATRDAEELCGIALRGSDDRILSLPALLALVNGRVPLLLEIKSTWTREGKYEANIALLLASYAGPVAVMSLDPDYWSQLSFSQRFAMRNLLTSTFARPHFIAYDIRALPAIAPLMAQTVFGLPLLAWTVRTKEDQDRALRYADATIFEGIRP